MKDFTNYLEIKKELEKIDENDFETTEEMVGEGIKVLKRHGVTKERLHLVPYSLIQSFMVRARSIE